MPATAFRYTSSFLEKRPVIFKLAYWIIVLMFFSDVFLQFFGLMIFGSSGLIMILSLFFLLFISLHAYDWFMKRRCPKCRRLMTSTFVREEIIDVDHTSHMFGFLSYMSSVGKKKIVKQCQTCGHEWDYWVSTRSNY